MKRDAVMIQFRNEDNFEKRYDAYIDQIVKHIGFTLVEVFFNLPDQAYKPVFLSLNKINERVIEYMKNPQTTRKELFNAGLLRNAVSIEMIFDSEFTFVNKEAAGGDAPS